MSTELSTVCDSSHASRIVLTNALSGNLFCKYLAKISLVLFMSTLGTF